LEDALEATDADGLRPRLLPARRSRASKWFLYIPNCPLQKNGRQSKKLASSLNQYVSRVIIYRHKFMNIDPDKLSYMYFRILDKYVNTSTTKCAKKFLKKNIY